MRCKLAIFDLDGTILDTLEDLADSLNEALTACGYPARSLDEVRRFVGNGIRKLMERGVPAGTAVEQIDKVHRLFSAHYELHCADKTKPYEGICELLVRLKANGYRLAVVSNKADAAVGKLCRQYFGDLFDIAVGERAGIRRKPFPDSVNEILERMKEPKENAVYIGDSDVDIETAKNAGLPCISVSWGFRDSEFLKAHGAALIVDSPAELEELLLQEYWDIYDRDKLPTGRRMKRNDWRLKDGEYHLTVLGVLRRPDGKFLITRRVLTKAWAPGWWEVPGGAVLAGESSEEAVYREIREETGLDVRGCEGGLLFTYRRENPGEGDNYFVDVYRFAVDFEETELALQPEETSGYRLVEVSEIRKLASEGIFLHYDSIRQAFE